MSYYDKDIDQTIVTSMNYEICEWDPETYDIVETYKYSWVIEKGLICDKAKVSLMGTLIFTGNMIGAVSFSLVAKFIGHKLTLLCAAIVFTVFIVITIPYSEYWYLCVISVVCCTMCNYICYSSMVICVELATEKMRSIFSSLLNLGHSLGACLFVLFYYSIGDWQIIFGIAGGALAFISIFGFIFLWNSPRSYLERNDFKMFMTVLEKMAKINGSYKEFKSEIEKKENQVIIEEIKSMLENNKKKKKDQKDQKDQTAEENKKESDVNDNVENKNKSVTSNSNKDQIVWGLNNNGNNDIENNVNNEQKEEEENKKSENGEKDQNNEENKETNNNLLPEGKNAENSERSKINDHKSDEVVIIKASSKELLDSKISDKQKVDWNENQYNSNSKYAITYWSLLKYASMRNVFLLFNFLWFCSSGTYYGLAIGVKSLPGDIYLNGVLLNFIEIPGYFIGAFWMNLKKLGRRGTLILFEGLKIAFFVIMIFIYKEEIPALVVSIFWRLFAVTGFGIYYTYCWEVYPSPIRALGFGINATFNNIGGMVIPFVNEYVNESMIYLIYAVVSAVCFGLMFFLPETVGKPWIETIKE
ncbi:MAG: MFS transporter, partial [Mycoplasma sp.]